MCHVSVVHGAVEKVMCRGLSYIAAVTHDAILSILVGVVHYLLSGLPTLRTSNVRTSRLCWHRPIYSAHLLCWPWPTYSAHL